jgi:hypothetical protein
MDSRRQIITESPVLYDELRHIFFPLDWNLFMKKSKEEGVSGIVFHNIRNYHLEGPIPPAILNSLTDIHFH